MLRVLGLTGLAAMTLSAVPAPSRQEVLNLQFGAGQFGCMTRAVWAMNADHSVQLRFGTPQDPGAAGMNLHVDRSGLRALLVQMTVSTKACGEQALYLLRPERQVQLRLNSLPMPPAPAPTAQRTGAITWPW